MSTEPSQAEAVTDTKTTRPTVLIRGVVFKKGGIDEDGGDFVEMIERDEYQDTLFLFNGNVRDDFDRDLSKGGGSAVIRPWAAPSNGFRASSIPTGWAPGAPFVTLDDQTRMVIDLSIERVRTIVHNVGYKRIFFPCDERARDRLGTSIFNVPAVVMDYINSKLAKLEERIQKCQHYVSLPIINWICREHVKQRIQRECSRVATTTAPALAGRSPLFFGGSGAVSFRQGTLGGPSSSNNYPPRMSPFGLAEASAASVDPRRAEPSTPRTTQQNMLLGKRIRKEDEAPVASTSQIHKAFYRTIP